MNIFRLIIDFCALGFIGKMFKTVDLPLISQFILMFYKDKPGAKWLPFLGQAKKLKKATARKVQEQLCRSHFRYSSWLKDNKLMQDLSKDKDMLQANSILATSKVP